MPGFAEVRGQDRVHDLLRGAAQGDRLPHAYLFVGRRGVGKTSTAFALARYLNCGSATGVDACGACPSCLKFAHFQHPDLHWFFPMPGSEKSDTGRSKRLKAEDRAEKIVRAMRDRAEGAIHLLEHQGSGAIAIGRDEDSFPGSVAQLRREAGMSPVEARVKVFVVTDAEQMTIEAANSLLKVLEEPPPRNLLVLTTERPSALLPTIVSRCQMLRFRDLPEELITELLRERFRIRPKGTRKKDPGLVPEPRAAGLAAALARGSVSHAAGLLLQGEVLERRDAAVVFLGLRPGDPRTIEVLKDLARAENRPEVSRLIDLGLLWQQDLLRAATGSDVPLANHDREDDVRAQARGLDPEEIRRRVNALEEAKQAMEGNVFMPLVLHGLVNGLAGEEMPPAPRWLPSTGRAR